MNTIKFRTMPTEKAAPVRVDRDAGIIYGVSAMQEGEALGHGSLIDSVMVQQVVDAGNATGGNGIKSRFTHPGMCEDGMGKMLGRARNFRVEGDKAVADLHLLDSAANSPSGDLRGYVMDLAEEDPEGFGMSIVFYGSHVWKLADGTEVEAEDWDPPEGSVSEMPFARLEKLKAVDAVDEPAANRDGLFSAAFSGTTNELSEQMFGQIDHWLRSTGVSLSQAEQFFNRYLAYRNRATGANERDAMSIDKKRLQELCAAHNEHSELIVAMYADDSSEERILAAIKESSRDQELSKAKAEAEEAKEAYSKLASEAEELSKQIEDSEAEKAELLAKIESLSAFQATGKDPGEALGGGAKRQVKRSELRSADASVWSMVGKGEIEVIED